MFYVYEKKSDILHFSCGNYVKTQIDFNRF